MSRKSEQDGPIVIKKYANRRLYDTQTSSYVTLEDLCLMVKEDKEFVVKDAKSNEDLTRQILTQIILEQELKGVNIMPADFLRSVIKSHDEQASAMMQSYLDNAMKAFTANQDTMKQYWEKGMDSFNSLGPIAQMEEMSKRNMDFFQKSMEMFSPANLFSEDYKKK
ncbi:MAG: polyhydroxyalkanoate synthesis repressor PhaR [Alphaproteobacteria bacterium]|nr:polyhydroxyalkanoate synthesis repressor PhaR [Alphaproteobacteria bacterium]